MRYYEALHHIEDDNGDSATVLVIEGAVKDVAAYIIGGEHHDPCYVFANGQKMTERDARREVSWPVRLTYRR